MSEGWKPSNELLDAMINAWLGASPATETWTTESISLENLAKNREIIATVLKAGLAKMREETLIRVIRAQVYEEERDRWIKVETDYRRKLADEKGGIGGGFLTGDRAADLSRLADRASGQAYRYDQLRKETLGGAEPTT